MVRVVVAVSFALFSCGGKSNPVDAVRASGPSIVITVGAPGLSAADVESGIVSVIESAIAEVPGVAHIRSESRDGQARLALELTAGADPIITTAAVKAGVSSTQHMLPSASNPPFVELGRRADAAVLRYTLSGPFTLAVLREAAAHTLGDRIAETDGVAGLDVCGGADPAVMVHADPAHLAELNVTLVEVESALEAARATPITNPATLALVEVAQRNGMTVRLSDVARISDDDAPSRCHALDERSDAAIEGIVYANRGVDAASVRTGALAAIEKVRATLPPGMILDVMPEDQPAALVGVTSADVAPVARVEQLRKVRDALLATGAQHVVLAEGVRDPMTGLADTDIEIRVWPASAERAALVRLAGLPALVVVRGDPKIVSIRGPDLATLRDMAGALAQRLTAAGVTALGRVGDGGSPRLEIRIDRSAATDLGVPVRTISETFTAAVDRLDLGDLTIAGKRDPVMLTTNDPNDSRTDPLERLRSLMVHSKLGAAVPISQVASFSQSLEPATIYHVDRERWVGVRISRDAVDAARKVIAAFAAPPGYRIEIE